MGKHSRPVYSTEKGRLCPDCGKAAGACACRITATASPAPSGPVKLLREVKGRGGKQVTVIRQLPLTLPELQLLAATLKSQCASGGTVNGNAIEIQGDHRARIKLLLEKQGYRVTLAGG